MVINLLFHILLLFLLLILELVAGRVGLFPREWARLWHGLVAVWNFGGHLKLPIMSRLVYFNNICFAHGAVAANHHKLSSLKQQKFVLSQFWHLEVQSPRCWQAVLPLKAVGEKPPCFWLLGVADNLWLVRASLPPLPRLLVNCSPRSGSKFPFLYKDPSHSESQAHPNPVWSLLDYG